ncbi:MAG TPA: hypothetical protein VGC42_29425 [Kofleriaceae bacterium]
MRSFLSTVLLSSSLLSATACMNKGGYDTASDDSAESAVDSAESAGAEGDMMMAAVDDSGTASAQAPLTADSVTATIAANLSARYSPQGCATVTVTGDSIKTTYHGCTGPRGLVHVDGELDLAVNLSTAGSVTVHATSTDLEVNGATLDVDATGTYTVTGTSHSLTVMTTGTGTGPRGRNIDHEGNYTISWDTANQCRTINGQWSTDIGLRDRSNNVQLSRCGGGCPTGSVAHNFLGNRTLTVTFDGTATAQWALTGGAGAGATGNVALSCQ